jgi:hypothetical protein
MKVRHVIKLVLILAGVYNFLSSMQYVSSIISLFFNIEAALFYSAGIIQLIYILGVSYIFIFKSDMVIDLMRLDKQFQEDQLEINLESFEVLLRVVILLVGLWLFASNIAEMIVDIFSMIRTANTVDAVNYDSTHNLKSFVSNLASIILGLYLILNYSRLANWIKRKNEWSN